MNDPLQDNFLALYIAIVWYEDVDAEQAFRILENSTKPRVKMRTIETLTNDELRAILKTALNPRFRNRKKLCKKFGITEKLLDSITESAYIGISK